MYISEYWLINVFYVLERGPFFVNGLLFVPLFPKKNAYATSRFWFFKIV